MVKTKVLYNVPVQSFIDGQPDHVITASSSTDAVAIPLAHVTELPAQSPISPTRSIDDGIINQTPDPTTAIPIRDPAYYKDGGDCILLVGQVLFKIHRFLLMRDSSAFGTMFSLPQSPDGEPPQGSSDENPITLMDNVGDFRALCWVLYAFPHETGAQYDVKRVNIPKIISLARICKKYDFPTLEKWSLDILSMHLNTQSPCKFADSCSASDLACILEHSVAGEAKQLEEFITKKWLERIREKELDVVYALDIAERLDLRKFQGSLYYLQFTLLSSPLLDSRPGSAVSSVQNELSILSLTPDQQKRLTNGVWQLTLFWLKLVHTMSKVQRKRRLQTQYLVKAIYLRYLKVRSKYTTLPPSYSQTVRARQSAAIGKFPRDPTYYKNDGDFTVLVHRFLLTRDLSTFNTTITQGSSSDNQVSLQDDVEDFRALCWDLHALHNKTASQPNPKRVHIPRLVSIARMCKKYEFAGIGRWSFDLLRSHLNPQSVCTFAEYCSAKDLSSILELFITGKDSDKQLTKFISYKWLERIHKGELDILYALGFAERLGSQTFQGLLYYVQLTKLSNSSLRQLGSSGMSKPAAFNIRSELFKLSLTPDQQEKLTSGFLSLTLLWTNLLDTMATAPVHRSTANNHTQGAHDGYSYYNQQPCNAQSWVLAFQRCLFLTRNSVDYFGNIDRMVEALEKDPDCEKEFRKMCSSCREKARKQLTDGRALLKASIASCFSG
ncbi:hypothetical protein AX16_004561 [Volvariella volvacea WC 439]|nr:hypothetical protein AX16_004561 [Volvariella volvacea WC 439]